MALKRGRPPSSKTLVDRQLGRDVIHPALPYGSDHLIPNHSGDHSAGTVQDDPVDDKDIVNKEYVDANTSSRHTLTAGLDTSHTTTTYMITTDVTFSDTIAWVMPRPGSVRSITLLGDIRGIGNLGAWGYDVIKNGSSLVARSIVLTGIQVDTVTDLFDRDTHTFIADDIIGIKSVVTGFLVNPTVANVICLLEVQYDT